MFLALIGAAAAQDCQALDLDVLSERAVVAVTDDELDRAEVLARQGIASLPCADRVPETEDLATLWQVLGAAAVLRGQPEAAQEPLLQAASVAPGWFNKRLGADVEAVFASAAPAAPVPLTVGPVPDGGTLYVDGAPQPAPSLAVAPGEHLVQVTVGAEVIWGDLVAVVAEPVLVDTGLPPPRSPWVRRGVILGGGAVGAYALGTVGMNALMRNAGSGNALSAARASQFTLAVGVAPSLAAAAGWCLIRHHQEM